MQKATWWLALSLLASPALAQTDASAKPKMDLYGRIHISLDGVDMRSSGDRPATAGQWGKFLQMPSNTSLIGFRGSHDLGSVKAIWQIESNVNATSGSAITNTWLSSRDTFAGLWTGYGTLKAGFFYSPYYYAVDKLDPLALTIADMRAVIHNTGWGNRVEFSTRLTNTIQYASPSFSGFEFQLQYANPEQAAGVPGGKRVTAFAPNPGDGDVLGGVWAMSLTYRNGPFYGAAAYERHNKVDRAGDGLDIEAEQAIELGASVALPTKTTVTGIYENISRAGALSGADRTRAVGLFLSVKQDIGDESLMATFALAGKSKVPDAKDGGGFFGLGAYHHFSKNTDAYLAFAKAFNDSAARWGLGTQGHGAVINPAEDGKGPMAVSIGLVHRFSHAL